MKRLQIGKTTLRVTQCRQKWRHSIGYILLPIPVVCCNIVSILQRFRDIVPFTVYVTTCGLRKSFVFDTASTYTFRFVYEHFLTSRKGFKQLKSDREGHSRSLVLVSFYKPHMTSY